MGITPVPWELIDAHASTRTLHSSEAQREVCAEPSLLAPMGTHLCTHGSLDRAGQLFLQDGHMGTCSSTVRGQVSSWCNPAPQSKAWGTLVWRLSVGLLTCSSHGRTSCCRAQSSCSCAQWGGGRDIHNRSAHWPAVRAHRGPERMHGELTAERVPDLNSRGTGISTQECPQCSSPSSGGHNISQTRAVWAWPGPWGPVPGKESSFLCLTRV